MKYKMMHTTLVIFVVFMLIFPVTAFAAARINLKPLISGTPKEPDNLAEPDSLKNKVTIKPMITISSRIDSNFYKTETDEKEVYTYVVRPGIELGYSTAKSSISLKYSLDAHFYNNQHGLSYGKETADVDDFIGHIFDLSARTKPFDRLTLGLDNSFSRTRESVKAERYSEPAERYKYNINRFTPMIFYEFENKFSAGLKYRNTVIDYEQDTDEDSTENRGIFDLVYNFSPETSLDLEYQYWQRDYDMDTSDYTSNQLRLILRKQFNYLSFEAGGGYHKRSFDKGTAEDRSIFSYRFAITAQNPPLPNSTPRTHIMFAAEQDFSDSGVIDNYYKAHQFTLSAGRIFREKILTKLEGKYNIKDYEKMTGTTPEGNEALREDDYYSLTATAGYMFSERISLNLSLGYENRDSNLDGYDYDNTYFKVSIDSTYDLGSR